MPTNNLTSNRNLNANANMTGGIIWVSGLAGANAWKQYPNTIDILMDNVNKDIYYIKIADEIGNCKNLRAFRYDEIPLEDVPLQDVNTPAMSNFVTKDDFNVFKNDFNAFKNEILDAIRVNNNNKKHNNGGSQRHELFDQENNNHSNKRRYSQGSDNVD